MKLPAGADARSPHWLRLSTHVVTVPSLPQLNVWKLMPRVRRKRLDVTGTGERDRRPTLAKPGTPPIAPLTRFAPSGAPGIGPLQP